MIADQVPEWLFDFTFGLLSFEFETDLSHFAIMEAETFRFAKMAFATRKRDEEFSVIERIYERTDSLFDGHLAFFHLAL